MTTATITTTGTLTTLALGDGLAINLPAQVRGIAITTEDALANALDWVSPADIHSELVAHWADAEAVKATPEQVVYHFVSWLASAGDWAE
jgi:hypothetical protein